MVKRQLKDSPRDEMLESKTNQSLLSAIATEYVRALSLLSGRGLSVAAIIFGILSIVLDTNWANFETTSNLQQSTGLYAKTGIIILASGFAGLLMPSMAMRELASLRKMYNKKIITKEQLEEVVASLTVQRPTSQLIQTIDVPLTGKQGESIEIPIRNQFIVDKRLRKELLRMGFFIVFRWVDPISGQVSDDSYQSIHEVPMLLYNSEGVCLDVDTVEIRPFLRIRAT